MLKLVYFKMRALAEAPQLLLNYCKINYEYIMSWDHFDDEWSNVKPKLAFKQLPMMQVEDGTQICQSIAILQYIENLGGLKISDPVKAAEATAVLQSAQDRQMAEYSRLLLERSTFASLQTVEVVAIEELQMKFPLEVEGVVQ